MQKSEQESIIRWDREERVAHLWTAYELEARRWKRLGYPVRVYSRTADGTPRTWAAEVPLDAIKWRQLRDGQVARRRGHRKGRLLGVPHDQVVVSAS